MADAPLRRVRALGPARSPVMGKAECRAFGDQDRGNHCGRPRLFYAADVIYQLRFESCSLSHSTGVTPLICEK